MKVPTGRQPLVGSSPHPLVLLCLYLKKDRKLLCVYLSVLTDEIKSVALVCVRVCMSVKFMSTENKSVPLAECINKYHTVYYYYCTVCVPSRHQLVAGLCAD